MRAMREMKVIDWKLTNELMQMLGTTVPIERMGKSGSCKIVWVRFVEGSDILKEALNFERIKRKWERPNATRPNGKNRLKLWWKKLVWEMFLIRENSDNKGKLGESGQLRWLGQHQVILGDDNAQLYVPPSPRNDVINCIYVQRIQIQHTFEMRNRQLNKVVY